MYIDIFIARFQLAEFQVNPYFFHPALLSPLHRPILLISPSL